MSLIALSDLIVSSLLMKQFSSMYHIFCVNREVLVLSHQSLEILALKERHSFVGLLLNSWEKLLCQATRLLLRVVFCFLM